MAGKMKRWYAGVTLKRLKKWHTKKGKSPSKKMQEKALKRVEDSLNELFSRGV